VKELIYHRTFFNGLRSFKGQTAVIDGSYRATYEQHADRVLKLANAMKTKLGLKRGDRFAVMALNSHQYLELYHAAYLGAGIINPLNQRLAGKELDYIVRDSGTRVLFVDQNFAAMFADATAAGGDNPIQKTILIGDGDGPCDIRYEDLLAGGDPEIPEEPEEDDPVVLMYTGGTTGVPKGVLVNQRAEALNAYHCAMVYNRSWQGAVNLMQTPMFHAASMVGILTAVPAGGCLVSMPMFEPGQVIDLIAEHGVTMTVMVPTMITMMLNHEKFRPEKLKSLEVLTYGASPMPAALLDTLLEMFPDIQLWQGYGMTEAGSVLTFLEPEVHTPGNPRLRSVGRAVPGVELSIQDAFGKILPAGEVGEVCSKGGNQMIEYWN
jgi:acyl-CoA synthetase (AMP-forming)/AMP-acid ligase II